MNSHDWGHGDPTDSLIRNPSSSWAPYYFRSIAYHKGAWVLHMLRRQLGDDDFFASLRAYLDDPALRYGNADSADFQRHCEEVSGQDLEWFFEQWLYRTTVPELEIDWNNYQVGEDQHEVRVRIRQVQEPGQYLGSAPYTLPVDLLPGGAGLAEPVTVWTDQLEQEFVIPVDSPATQLYVDPDRWLLHRTTIQQVSAAPHAQGPANLLPAYPNPFNPRCLLRWETAAATTDVVEIYDVMGRRLLREQRPSAAGGPREFLWTGKYEDGLDAPSGTYLYRITCRGEDGRTWRLQDKVTLAR